jgi:two-component system nitrogen regulation response regulator NtrX
VRATLKRVAPTGSRVLITGPAGVGKEIAARMIHNGARAPTPFIVVSAAMMSPERVEEELFGSEADGVARPGLLEQAHGGTLFLDEIADMPLTTQAKILRVLTDQSYHRVGGQRPVKVDVRVLSATSRNLSDEIAAGRFREDLYYRLNVVPVRFRRCASGARTFPSWSAISSPASPPSGAWRRPERIRGGDGRAAGARLAGQRPPAAQHHRADDDPAPGDRVGASRSTCCRRSPRRAGRSAASPARRWRSWAAAARGARIFEREYLKIQIRRFSGNISRTASFIGMERSALHRKLKALGLGDKRDDEE